MFIALAPESINIPCLTFNNGKSFTMHSLGTRYRYRSAPTLGLFTHDIFTHNIAIKRHFLSKYYNYISKSIQINRNRYFQLTQEKKYWMKNVFLHFYCNIFLSQYCVQKYCVWIRPYGNMSIVWGLSILLFSLGSS